jgi:1-acyl-sn-glycerol-3-phosphate acyltransferase
MIKTGVCFLILIVSMVLVTPFGIIAVLLSLLGLRKAMSVFTHSIAVGWGRFMLAAVGCKVTVLGRENIPRKGGVCFVSNHSGIVDILLLLGYSGRRFGFVAKRELMLAPILNMWIPMLGGLFIDRANPRKALKTINKGVARIKAGSAMLIFPEGHRSRGQGLLPFHPGSLKLATQSESIIVPVAITGSYDVFEKDYRVHAVPLRIVFCPPINTADIPVTDRKLALSDQIYGVIKAALEG